MAESTTVLDTVVEGKAKTRLPFLNSDAAATPSPLTMPATSWSMMTGYVMKGKDLA